MSREELVGLVQRIMDSDGTEEELDQLSLLVEQNVPHPRLDELIFYSDKPRTAEEIVDEALKYKPIAL